MIKIMNPSLSLTEMVNDASNGLGVITPISGEVREKMNGEYELTFTVGMSEKRYSELSCGTVVQTEAGETTGLQLFRIYKITKPMNGIVTVYARHITYDLNKAAVMPFSATGASAALRGLKSHLVGSYPFTVSTDITNTSSKFAITQPVTFRSALGGVQGSILDVFGGEYEWDNLTVKLLAHRGSDNGVTIEYGKNLIDLKQEENIENTYTAVLGFAQTADTTVTGTIQHAVETASPKTKIVDFSSEFSPDEVPTVSRIDQLARAYIEANDIGKPSVNISVKFQPLWQTEEYKDIARLERVKLGDTVTVKFPKLGVEAKAEVVKTVWNVALDRYDSIEIGNVRSSLASTILGIADGATEKVSQASGFLEGYVSAFTSLVANSMGLFKSVEVQADGSQKVYLHNKPTRTESQYQWTINSEGFFLSQDYGQTWSAGIDAQGNAVFNSLAANVINAMTINGSVINSGKLYSGEQYWFAGTENEAVLKQYENIYDPEYPYAGDYKGISIDGKAVRLRAINGVAVLAVAEGTGKDAAGGFVAVKPNGSITMRAKSGATAVLGTSESTISSPNGKNYVRITDSSVEVRDKANNNIIMMNSSGVAITIQGTSVRDLGYVTIDVSGHRYKVLGEQEH